MVRRDAINTAGDTLFALRGPSSRWVKRSICKAPGGEPRPAFKWFADPGVPLATRNEAFAKFTGVSQKFAGHGSVAPGDAATKHHASVITIAFPGYL